LFVGHPHGYGLALPVEFNFEVLDVANPVTPMNGEIG